MKYLWRVLVLFFLPGMIAGGCTVAAFFRWMDSGLELLKVQSFAALLWLLSAGAAMLFFRHVRGIYRFYYPVAALMAIGFSLGCGVVRCLGGNGSGEGVAGVIVSGAAMGVIILAFCADTYTTRDRISWIAGTLCGGLIWFLATLKLRLAWMETGLFYLCILLLISWLFASPLTRWGSGMRRWLWRTVLLTSIFAAYWVTPMFSYRPWNPPPAAIADGLWVKTYVTPQGSSFGYVKKDDIRHIFSPDGRWLAGDIRDDGIWASVAALAACSPNKNEPNMLLAAPENSSIPAIWKNLGGKISAHYVFPESLRRSRRFWQSVSLELLSDGQADAFFREKNVDVLLLTALPENPYPAFIRKFLEYNSRTLHHDGVAAVTADLLQNPVVFAFLNERFRHCAVLPSPGHIWLFSDKPLAASVKELETALDEYLAWRFGDNAPVPQGLFSVLCSNNSMVEIVYPASEKTTWGKNSLSKPWWVFLLLIGVVFVWRFLRLFGERRDIMYSWWNSVENGFAGMGLFLLAQGLLITQYGVFTLAPAVLSLLFVFILLKYPAGGVWGNLIGFFILLMMLCGASWPVYLLMPVMIQTMLFTGSSYPREDFSVDGQKSLTAATLLGMLLAALFMVAVWQWSMPLLAAWGIFLAARLPGIWQTANKRVY